MSLSARTAALPATITASASGSIGGTSPIASYTFDFGDGSAAVGPQPASSASHVYNAAGTYTVTATAVDAAGQSSSATTTVTVTCPCSVLWPTNTPGTVDSGDGASYELGMRIQPTTAGNITGVRFYKSAANTGTHTGSLWSAGGTLLATGTFGNETAGGWQTLTFATPVPVKAGTGYVVSYHTPNGHYSFDAGYFTNNGAGSAPIQALQDSSSAPDGLWAAGSTSVFPTNGNNGANYWVDAVFDTAGVPSGAPTVTTVAPASGATGVASATSAVTAKFSAPVDSSTLTFTVTDSSGAAVAGSTSYSAATNTATFAPSTQLPVSTTFTAAVQAADQWGRAATGTTSWTFTTGAANAAYTCPCSLFPSAATPQVANSTDTAGAELGVQFSSAIAGKITGVRFYKGSQNTGTHTGSLWSASGTLLATGTFTNETAGGWQTLTFATPVAITAGTTYIASYHAPVAHYSYDTGYFSYQHLAYPLSAPASTSTSGNGLYAYTAGTSLPVNSANGSNYWIDPVFTP